MATQNLVIYEKTLEMIEYGTITLLAILLLCSAVPCRAADKWTKQDYLLEAAVIAVNGLDWITTKNLVSDDETNRYTEANRMIYGTHPSSERLGLVAVGSSALHALVTHYLPQKYRKYWQASWIVVKTGAVANNLHLQLGGAVLKLCLIFKQRESNGL